MKLHQRIIAALAVACSMVPVTYGFFSELDELKAELISWQSEHSTDFSDLLATIGKISGSPFADISDLEWYHPYVAAMSSWGFVSGTKDAGGNLTGKFEPGRSVTVAEGMKIAIEAARVPLKLCDALPRLPQAQDHWAKQYVSCAEKLDMKIMRTAGLDLNRPLTRAESVGVILAAFSDSVLPLAASYPDAVGHPLEKEIAHATVLGMVAGDDVSDPSMPRNFRPNASVSRAEFVKIAFGRLKVEAAKRLLAKK